MARAVVIGASVAGVLAARVLSAHVDEVVIVERDDLGDGTSARKAVPQGRQPHAVLNRGLVGMEAWFPDLRDELVAGGALSGDAGWDFRWWQGGRSRVQVRTDLQGVMMTRPFLESTIRARALALGNVRVEAAACAGLTATGSKVDGVVVTDSGGQDQRIEADLVVDCSGRSTRLPEWLAALGYPAPPVEEVKVQIGYAARLFERGAGGRLDDGAMGLACLPVPPRNDRAAFVFAVEGDRWLVGIGGAGSARPTADVEEFTSTCIEMGVSPLSAVVKGCAPIGEVATHRFHASVRRDFHRMASFPSGLLAAGDAIASFNPIYGQGMTCAVVHIQGLEAELASSGVKVDASRYFKAAKKITDLAWTTAVTEDFRRADTEGKRPRGTAMAHKLGDLYARASLTDPQLHARFLRVLQMRDTPPSLLHPGALLRLARAGRRSGADDA